MTPLVHYLGNIQLFLYLHATFFASQCGATTIVKQILANQKGALHLNWASVENQNIITERSWDEKAPIL